MSKTAVTSPLAPMTPDAVMSTFNYLRSIETGDAAVAADIAGAEPGLPGLLVDVAERIVVPVTALREADPELCDDSFALKAAGRVFIATLRRWAQAGPGAVEGIAYAVLQFIAQILTEEHEDIVDILRQLHVAALGQAMQAHPAPAGAVCTSPESAA